MMISLFSVSNESIKLIQNNKDTRPVRIGIQAIIKYMEKFGYENDMYDYYDTAEILPDDEKIREYLLRVKPTIVGMSAVISSSYGQVKRISKIIRETLKDCFIVVGGNMAITYHVLLNKTDVDICVLGPGEKTWIALLEYNKKHGIEIIHEELTKIRGIAYKYKDKLYSNGYGEKIKNLQNPDYNIFNFPYHEKANSIAGFIHNPITSEYIVLDKKVAQISTSKGCTATCTFCQRSSPGYNIYEIDELEKYLIYLIDNFDVGFITLMDENFGANKKHAYEVAKLFKKYKLFWSAGGVRCVNVDDDDIVFYKNHNCLELKYGVESGSQVILDIMEKKFTVERVLSRIVNTMRNGIMSRLQMLIGLPGENNDTVKDTGKMLGELCLQIGVEPSKFFNSGYISTNLLIIFPGTPTYEYARNIGIFQNIDEEEKYLEGLAEQKAGLYTYVNVTGMPLKDVMFWKRLMIIETTRYFYKNISNKSIESEDILKIFEATDMRYNLTSEYYKKNNKLIYFKMKLESLVANFFTSKFITLFPDKLVDVFLKNMFWYAHLIISKLKKQEKLNDKKVPKLEEIYPNIYDTNTKRIERSLKTIVQKMQSNNIKENINVNY